MLTRRGWALATVAVGGFALAAAFGARALNGVVGPALVALAGGYLQLGLADRPELRAETPEYGFAGETATVALAFAVETPRAGTVRLRTDEGLTVETDEVGTTIADGRITFDVTLDARGVRSVGPVDVTIEDLLGLWRTTHSYHVSREIVVFPRIHQLNDAGEFASLHSDMAVGGRDRFDRLREYERGDPLRDVHWKSSAKRGDDLVVMEYEADERREQVEVLAEADAEYVDDFAEAAGSVATHLLDAGLAVGLVVPGDRLDPDAGEDHRTELLTMLARIRAGTVGDARREDVDAVVTGRADEEAVLVTVDGRTVTFGQLSDGAALTGEPSDADDWAAVADGDPAGGERR